jgi:hypothetical protein
MFGNSPAEHLPLCYWCFSFIYTHVRQGKRKVKKYPSLANGGHLVAKLSGMRYNHVIVMMMMITTNNHHHYQSRKWKPGFQEIYYYSNYKPMTFTCKY